MEVRQSNYVILPRPFDVIHCISDDKRKGKRVLAHLSNAFVFSVYMAPSGLAIEAPPADDTSSGIVWMQCTNANKQVLPSAGVRFPSGLFYFAFFFYFRLCFHFDFLAYSFDFDFVFSFYFNLSFVSLLSSHYLEDKTPSFPWTSLHTTHQTLMK